MLLLERKCISFNCNNPSLLRTVGLKEAYATVRAAALPEQIGALTL